MVFNGLATEVSTTTDFFFIDNSNYEFVPDGNEGLDH